MYLTPVFSQIIWFNLETRVDSRCTFSMTQSQFTSAKTLEGCTYKEFASSKAQAQAQSQSLDLSWKLLHLDPDFFYLFLKFYSSLQDQWLQHQHLFSMFPLYISYLSAEEASNFLIAFLTAFTNMGSCTVQIHTVHLADRGREITLVMW